MSTTITAPLLTALGCSESAIARHLPHLETLAPEHGITTPLRIGHFLAQVCHESQRLEATAENLNYGGRALMKIWPSRFSPREAEIFQRHPDAIANRVYALRLGNGPESSGDGFRYRGRGLAQLTGRSNYAAFSRWIGADVVAEPDRVEEEFCCASAVWFWRSINGARYADADDLRGLRRAWNGPRALGIRDCAALLATAKAVLTAA